MNELDQLEANTNNNYMPDDAFTAEPAAPAEAFQTEDRPASAFAKDYSDLTQDEKFASHKEAVYRKHGVTDKVTAMTVAEAMKTAETSKVQVHQDGSMTVAKGILGNEKDSLAMIKILREQAYQRHNITD